MKFKLLTIIFLTFSISLFAQKQIQNINQPKKNEI